MLEHEIDELVIRPFRIVEPQLVIRRAFLARQIRTGMSIVRLTCTRTLFMCLGPEDTADLRAPLRASEGYELLNAEIDEAISRRPKGHDFIIDRRHNKPAVSRHMSVTGG